MIDVVLCCFIGGSRDPRRGQPWVEGASHFCRHPICLFSVALAAQVWRRAWQ